MSTQVNDVREKKWLLSQMVDFRNAGGASSVEWMEYFVSLLINMPTRWTRESLALKDDFADRWRGTHGEWLHSAGNTVAHNWLGMAYAWWSVYEAKEVTKIQLADSPDFSGPSRLSTDPSHSQYAPIWIYGDIGQCGPAAMAEALHSLVRIHSIWISVIDWNTRVVVEFLYNLSNFQMINSIFGERRHTIAIARDVFYCGGCKKWSIPQNEAEHLIEDWLTKTP